MNTNRVGVSLLVTLGLFLGGCGGSAETPVDSSSSALGASAPRVDPTDPGPPVDPVDPTDPGPPVDPVDPVDPTDPGPPVDPVDPTDPGPPVDPPAPGPPAPLPGPCSSSECGKNPYGMPNFQCSDGTTGGPICESTTTGVCGWHVRGCLSR